MLDNRNMQKLKEHYFPVTNFVNMNIIQIPGKVLFPQLWAKILSANQIAGFFKM